MRKVDHMARKFGLALVALAAIAVGGWVSLGGRSADPTLPGLGMAGAQTATVEVPEIVVGNPDAKVVVTEYASFTCPHCASFHGAVFKPLKSPWAMKGRSRHLCEE